VGPYQQLNEARGLFQDHNKREARIQSQALLSVFNIVWYSVNFTAIRRIYLRASKLVEPRKWHTLPATCVLRATFTTRTGDVYCDRPQILSN